MYIIIILDYNHSHNNYYVCIISTGLVCWTNLLIKYNTNTCQYHNRARNWLRFLKNIFFGIISIINISDLLWIIYKNFQHRHPSLNIKIVNISCYMNTTMCVINLLHNNVLSQYFQLLHYVRDKADCIDYKAYIDITQALTYHHIDKQEFLRPYFFSPCVAILHMCTH